MVSGSVPSAVTTRFRSKPAPPPAKTRGRVLRLRSAIGSAPVLCDPHGDERRAHGEGHEQPAYRACLVNAMLLAAKGKKMSKSRGHVAEPGELFDQVGLDAARSGEAPRSRALSTAA